jgi:DNA-directed RNA polymerase specialized sigma24 family protein
MTPPRPELEALLENAAWTRALARSLTRDAHRADDLVQRTFVAALEHPRFFHLAVYDLSARDR